jgi:mycothiol system anti-sigma-R factor
LYQASRDSSFELLWYRAPRPRRVTPQEMPAAQYSASYPAAPSGECAVVLDSIWDYLDGNCCDQTAARLIAHVPACAPCGRQMAIQQQFLESLAELRERSRAPAGLRKIVRRALAAEVRPGALGG